MSDWEDTARLLIESAGVVVGDGSDLGRIRGQRFVVPGFSRDMCRTIAESGWLSMGLSEDIGGAALGVRECCALLEVLGAGLVPEPVVSSMLAVNLLGEQVPESVLSGDEVLVSAWQDATNSLDFQGAVNADGLQGKKVHVAGVVGADWLAVLSGKGVALISTNMPGIDIQSHQMHDGCLTGTVNFDNIDTQWYPVLDADRMLDEATLVHCAYLLGVSERAFEITLDYLKIREQFGKPIGSFQSLQHRAADIKMQIELSRAGLFAVAGRIDNACDSTTRSMAVSRCKARSAELAMLVARESMQMHGAIGMSDEADIGLYVRKALTEANSFGSAAVHRARYTAAQEVSAL